MGFETTIYLGTTGNNLSSYVGGLPALSTITAGNNTAIILDSVRNAFLTAFVTEMAVTQSVYNGGVVYVTNQNGIFSLVGSNVNPLKFYNTGPRSEPIFAQLSATGQECASGLQTGTIQLTFSSTALSGTSAGVTGAGVIPVTVLNTVTAFSFSVYAINTPVGPYICQTDLSRMVQGYLG